MFVVYSLMIVKIYIVFYKVFKVYYLFLSFIMLMVKCGMKIMFGVYFYKVKCLMLG